MIRRLPRQSVTSKRVAGIALAAGALALTLGVGGMKARGEAGALDPSFGAGGRVATGFGSRRDNEARAVAIQPDGKIVVAGSSGGYFAVARYTKSGNLDPSFGTGGKVLTHFGDAFAVAIQPDGKIVVAGSSGSDISLIRYTTSGALDTGFGTGGKVRTDFGFIAYAVAIQPDGKIVVAGERYNGTAIAVARYTKSGTLDTSFGTGGIVRTPVGASSNFSDAAVAIQRNGKIVVAGNSGAHGTDHIWLARYTARGRLDPRFGTDGKVLTGFGPRTDTVASAVAIQSKGEIVVAGSSWPNGTANFALARYTARGTLDPRFGTKGKVQTHLRSSGDDDANALAIQTDGEIVVAGDSAHGSRACRSFAVVRYTPVGRLDTSFGRNGSAQTAFGNSSCDYATAIAVQNNGRIVVAGTRYQKGDCGAGPARCEFALARYLP